MKMHPNSNAIGSKDEPPACAPPNDRPTRPTVATPEGACECHSHIFGPREFFPFARERSYTPPDAPLEHYLAMHQALGISRGVLVQGSAHGLDNAALLNALEREPLKLRGVAVIDQHLPFKSMRRMRDVGIRGLRFNHLFKNGQPAFKGGAGIDVFFELRNVMADLGWHMQLWTDCQTLPDVWPSVQTFPFPIVVDHMGRVDARQGPGHKGFDFLLKLLAEGRIWVKLSGVYRASDHWPEYPEVRSYHQALVQANPDQCLWGLDWPHPALSATMPNDGALLDLFNAWTPDAKIRQKILVDNPARLYGFHQQG